VNPAYLALFGFPPVADLSGRLVLDLIAPDRRSQIQEYVLRRAQGEPVPKTYETRGLRNDGTEFDMEMNVSIYQENGEENTLVILRDIAEQKRIEEELRENQARLDLALQSAHMGVWRWEIRENRCYFDDLTCQLQGIEATKFNGAAEEFLAAVHPEEYSVTFRWQR